MRRFPPLAKRFLRDRRALFAPAVARRTGDQAGFHRGGEVFDPHPLQRRAELFRRDAAADLDRKVNFFTTPMPIREIMWSYVIHHGIHHRGQLSLLCRLAGGQPPGLYGPNREEMAAMVAEHSTGDPSAPMDFAKLQETLRAKLKGNS